MTNTDLHSQLTAIATDVRPVDLYDRALGRSRQIRRRRTAASAVSAVVAAVAIASAMWQLLPSSGHAPQPAETGTPTLTSTTGPESTVPQFFDQTLQFPDWPGPTEAIGLGTCPREAEVSGFREDGMYVYVGDSVVVDVPGATHWVGQFTCFGPSPSFGSAGMVVAYRPDSDGIILVDKIVDTTLTPEEGVWAFVTGLRLGPADGTVLVSLKVRLPGAESELGYERGFEVVRQERTYAWDGLSYVQTSGPTSFRAYPSLQVTSEDLVFGPAEGPCRTGTMTLTVTNSGSAPVEDAAIMLALPGLGDRDIIRIDCPAPATQEHDGALVPVGRLDPGQTHTVTATVVVNANFGANDDAARFDSGEFFAEVRVANGQLWTDIRAPFVIDY